MEIESIYISRSFDPFADAAAVGNDDISSSSISSGKAAAAEEYVHVRVQQRNGKKCLTTVQGVRREFALEKILKDFRKQFCCNGNVVEDKELGKVIQLQGDHRKNVSQFLVAAGIVKKELIKIHGF